MSFLEKTGLRRGGGEHIVGVAGVRAIVEWRDIAEQSGRSMSRETGG